MQQGSSSVCPRCIKPLQKFNGRIGYCSVHKWVSPFAEFQAEADEQNRRDEEEANRKRLDEEKRRLDREHEEQQKRQQAAVRRMVAAIAAVLVVAVAVVIFVVRPGMNYQGAADSFAAGDYAAARSSYEALGDYKDARTRVLLCDAMLDLRESRAEAAVEKLEQLTGEGAGEMARQVADALLPIIRNWRSSGLSADALLMLLGKADVIDPEGTLDVAALKVEGHTALLDGTQLSSYAADVDADGAAELIALNADHTVTVYRMTADSNARMAVDNAVAASCALTFGQMYGEKNLDEAIACYEEAFRLNPDEESRGALTAACRARVALREDAGDMASAISDAKRAMEVSGAEAEFSFYYEMNLRACRNGHDTETALTLWDAFAVDAAAEISRFSARNRWQSDAAQLHIQRATELAAQRDEGCIGQLRRAAELGADVSEAVTAAQSCFGPGLSLVKLRMLEMELFSADAQKVQKVRVDMADEICTAISEWQERGITPVDVPALIHIADEQSVDLSGIDWRSAYDKAVMAAAGAIRQSAFVDWDGDGYRELLVLEESGALKLYGMAEAWQVVSMVDTKLPGGAFAVTGTDGTLVLITAANKDEMLVVSGTGAGLTILFRESGLCRYAAQGMHVTFSRELEGSIKRYVDYAYEAADASARPVRTGIDWQQADYPRPADAAAALQRYFEAAAYGIDAEKAVLTAAPDAADAFTADALAALAQPDVPGTVQAAAYMTGEDKALFEVVYPSGTQTIRTWVAAAHRDGWKVTGAADTYGAGLDASAADYSISLISLNADTQGSLTARGSRSTYRVLVPESGRMELIWKSGSKAASRTAYNVTMARGSLTGDAVFSFDLQPSPNKQQSKSMFLAAGVYYVTVEAKIANAEPYTMKLSFAAEEHIELESNNTAATATAIALETAWAANLSDAKDVDFYSFTIAENSAVNVTLNLSGNGSRSTAYTCTVYSAADGGRLCAISATGNAMVAQTGKLYLAPGSYLVQVAKGSTFLDDEYRITVSASQEGVMEAEANDTAERANAIPVNVDVHASIGQEGDVDCYTFTLAEDAVIQPRFSFRPTDTTSRTYVLTLMDSSRHELLKANIGGKESAKVMVPLALGAGTYTVRIENPRFVQQEYTLHLVCESVANAEREPNNTEALAMELPMGTAVSGVLSSEADVDFYRVTFAEQTQVTLDFKFVQGVDKSTAFVVTVLSNGKSQLTTNIKGDTGGMSSEIQFPAGEYYIRVKPSKWLGAVYTIEIH